MNRASRAWAFLGLLGASLGLGACGILIGATKDQPTPVPSVVPAVTPGPAPTPLVLGQYVEGEAVLYVQGLDSIPLSKDKDDWFLFGLTWEQHGYEPNVPVLGVHVRGTSQSDRGFLFRWSANIASDQVVYKAHGEEEPDLFCGSGQNYHYRKPAADGLWRVKWDQERIRVESPLGVQEERLPVRGSAGFGRVIFELPSRKVGRYHLWHGFEAWPVGARSALLQFTGKSGVLAQCVAGQPG